MGGVAKILGQTLLQITIGTIKKKVLVYVLDSDSNKYDVIVGLDLIPQYKIKVSDSLIVSQLGDILTPVQNSDVKSTNFLKIEMMEEKLAHLEPQNKIQLENLLKTYGKSFAQHAFDVGNVKNYECSIELSSDKYIAKKPYRCSYADQVKLIVRLMSF